MNDVPLIQKADINSINTSIIAIKKQLKQLTEAVGLIDIPDMPDLSPFVKKTDVADVVEADNMNPVTSNAVAEYTVDEVTSGNMHSVSSNAVAGALSQLTDIVNGKMSWIVNKENSASTCDISGLGNGVYLVFASDLYHTWDAYYIGVLEKFSTSNRRLTTISNRTLTLTVSGDTLSCNGVYYIWRIKILKIGY